MIHFRKHYFIAACFLFFIEALIALFAHDKIIRPYMGDFLVVILVYCCLRAFLNISVLQAAIGTLLFACFVEYMQHLNLVKLFHLHNSRIATTFLGNTFEWMDILVYAAGNTVIVLA
jgi:hypothetical protein